MHATGARMTPAASLHVEIDGSGPAVALVHGWGLNLRVWDELRADLARTHTVHAIDLPGHGRSPFDPGRSDLRAQAAAVLDALPARFTLMGWSLGGQLALQIASTAQARVTDLILVATTPKFQRDDTWPAGLRPSVLETFATFLGDDYRGTVADFLELQVRGSTDAELVLRKLRAALFAHGEATTPALLAGLRILRDTDLRAELPGIAARTLVISGQYDRITPPAASAALCAMLPHARALEFRRAGHAPFLSHASEFTAAVQGFFAEAAG